MALDALRLVALAALAATLSGCGCSGDGEAHGDGKTPGAAGGPSAPAEAEAPPPRDEWADMMRDPKYLAKTDELHARLNAALRRVHDASGDLKRAIEAGANAQALSVYSNAVKAAAEDVQRIREESQRVVAAQIRIDNAQREKLEKNNREKKLDEKRDGGKGK